MVYSPSLDMLVHIGLADTTPYLKGKYAGNETMGFRPLSFTGTFPADIRNFEWSTMGGYYVCYEVRGSYFVHRLVPPPGDRSLKTVETQPNPLCVESPPAITQNLGRRMPYAADQ